jgi:hypothetical protein
MTRDRKIWGGFGGCLLAAVGHSIESAWDIWGTFNDTGLSCIWKSFPNNETRPEQFSLEARASPGQEAKNCLFFGPAATYRQFNVKEASLDGRSDIIIFHECVNDS